MFKDERSGGLEKPRRLRPKSIYLELRQKLPAGGALTPSHHPQPSQSSFSSALPRPLSATHRLFIESGPVELIADVSSMMHYSRSAAVLGYKYRRTTLNHCLPISLPPLPSIVPASLMLLCAAYTRRRSKGKAYRNLRSEDLGKS